MCRSGIVIVSRYRFRGSNQNKVAFEFSFRTSPDSLFGNIQDIDMYILGARNC